MKAFVVISILFCVAIAAKLLPRKDAHLLSLSDDVIELIFFRYVRSAAKGARICKQLYRILFKRLDVDLIRISDSGYLESVISWHFPNADKRNACLVKIATRLGTAERRKILTSIILTCLSVPIGTLSHPIDLRSYPIDLRSLYHFAIGKHPFNELDTEIRKEVFANNFPSDFCAHEPMDKAVVQNFPDPFERYSFILELIAAQKTKKLKERWIDMMFKVNKCLSSSAHLLRIIVRKAPYDNIQPELINEIITERRRYQQIQQLWLKAISANPELYPDLEDNLKALPFEMVLKTCYQIVLRVKYKGKLEPKILLHLISRTFEGDLFIEHVAELAENGTFTQETLTPIDEIVTYANAVGQEELRKALIEALNWSGKLRCANECVRLRLEDSIREVDGGVYLSQYLLSEPFVKQHHLELAQSVFVISEYSKVLVRALITRKKLEGIDKKILLERMEPWIAIQSSTKKRNWERGVVDDEIEIIIILSGLDDRATEKFSSLFAYSSDRIIILTWLGTESSKFLTKTQRVELLKRMPSLMCRRKTLDLNMIVNIDDRTEFLRILYNKLTFKSRCIMLSLLDGSEFTALFESVLDHTFHEEGSLRLARIARIGRKESIPYLTPFVSPRPLRRTNKHQFQAMVTLTKFIGNRIHLALLFSKFPWTCSHIIFLTDEKRVLDVLEKPAYDLSLESYVDRFGCADRFSRQRAYCRARYQKYVKKMMKIT